MCKPSNLKIQLKTTKDASHRHSIQTFSRWVCVACACMLYAQHSLGAGGCGSVCLPLEALDPERTPMHENQYRIAYSIEHANFDNFREGGDDINNPGGNKATISQGTLFYSYGVSEKWTTTLLLPYIRKKQQTNMFGTRVAEGLADISLFGHYEYLQPSITEKTSVSFGLGLKFPTGSIDEPDSGNLLPPAFQAGSGAYDIIPTVSYYKQLNNGSLFGDIFWRIPLEDNKRGYKFGQEIELNAGREYRLPYNENKYSILLATSVLHAEHDEDSNTMLPPRLREGTKALNSGGDFIDLVAGARVQITRQFSLQLRFSVPIYENWNGDRANNVGQVAPDLTTQIILVYTGVKDNGIKTIK